MLIVDQKCFVVYILEHYQTEKILDVILHWRKGNSIANMSEKVLYDI